MRVFRRNKRKVSAYKNAAQIRALVRAEEKRLQKLLPSGEFVNEKYITKSVGMIVGDVKARRRLNSLSLGDMDPGYAARHLYLYFVKVMWLAHPELEQGGYDQVMDMNAQLIKVRNPKKKVV